MAGNDGDTILVRTGHRGRSFPATLSGSGKCRRCLEPILWCKTPNEKNMPLDPESVEGEYVSHFATCPTGKTEDLSGPNA